MFRHAAILFLWSGIVVAAEPVNGLSVFPPKVELKGPHDGVQLLVTYIKGGVAKDVTREVTYRMSGEGITVSKGGMVRAKPGSGGFLTIIPEGGGAVQVPVSGSAKADCDPSFVRDVMPVLGKLGCNAGTCHGAQAGKNGFKLSLRGYDPLYDHRSLTDDLEGRRFNRAAPDRSLMLLKSSGVVPHVGGALMQPGEPNYELLKAWIAKGVKFDGSTSRVASIEMFPKNPTLQRIGEKQQFAVIAKYPDGSTRDVTAEAFIDSSNTETATVDKTGLLTTVRRGEATMLARYEGAYAASTVVVMGDRSGFAWKDVPANNKIDELVDAKLKRLKIQPSGMCTDEEFVRRIYLDLTGLPPSSDVIRKFFADQNSSQVKRQALINNLLGSPEFVDHWTNKWCDLLQVNRKFLGEPGAKAYRAWIRKAVEGNMPYDKFAYELLTGTGSNVESPTASYYKIHRDAETVMENTTQLFLATRFNCNKCHDHPFERWTQDQYYQLSAFFAQVERKEDPKYKGQKLGGTAVEKAVSLVEVVTDAKTGEINHARTGQPAAPKFPYDIAVTGDGPRRMQAAKWITSNNNPYFARSYVNRVWSYLTGVGLIEPIDDIRAGNPPSNPELLDYLTAEFIKCNYDTQALIRMICRSRTYQLSIATNEWNKDDETNYSHAVARRLPAEVLFDAVYSATGSVSKLPGLPPGARAAQMLDGSVELPGGFLELLGKPVRESVCECERSSTMMLGPVLAFINGPVVGDAVQDPNSRLAKFVIANKDDAKVVEEVYLSVFNRFPTEAEKANGIKAIRAAAGDHAALMEEHRRKQTVFDDYNQKLDAKQAKWEQEQLTLKPTEWTVLKPVKVTSKAGPTPAAAKGASKLEIQEDGSVRVSGAIETVDTYTVETEIISPKTPTAFRLEALPDPSLPKNGPGRSAGGNFVLNDLKANFKPKDKPNAKAAGLKFEKPTATFSQDGYGIDKAVDGDAATGWAVYPKVGQAQTALLPAKAATAVSPFKTDKGATVTFVLDQRYGSGHTLGKFRLSYTTDPNPRLGDPVPANVIKMIETPAEKRTAEQKADLRKRYLAQDMEYAKLKADAEKVPPGDPRVLGAQDLVWALLNNPAFLFNR